MLGCRVRDFGPWLLPEICLETTPAPTEPSTQTLQSATATVQESSGSGFLSLRDPNPPNISILSESDPCRAGPRQRRALNDSALPGPPRL